jgi:hypothetical protein
VLDDLKNYRAPRWHDLIEPADVGIAALVLVVLLLVLEHFGVL